MLFNTKIDPGLIQRTAADAERRFPGRKALVLVDQDWGLPELEFIDVMQVGPEVLDGFAPSARVYVYACDQDDVALPFIERIVSRGDKFIPAFKGDPAWYANIDHAARRALEDEFVSQTRDGYALFEYGPFDFMNIAQGLHITRKLPGSYVEIGCFRGSSGGVALRYLRYAGIARTCYFLDVFEGFTYDAARASPDAFWVDTHQTEGLEVVRARLKAHEDVDKGVLVNVVRANIIEDEIPAEAGQICLANLDVDMYEAVYAGLRKLHPCMVSGGIIILEDAGHTPWLIGARLALEQFLAAEGADGYTSVYMHSGQAFLIRR